MRIVYDNIIFSSQKSGGISVVWGELLRRALRDGLDLSFVEFTPTDNLVRQDLQIPRQLVRQTPASLRKLFKYLPVFASGREDFLFHSSFFRTCPNPHAINITTVHDFTNELYQTGSGARKERWIKHKAIRQSDFIICISDNTRSDFFRFFPDFPRERVRVIYNGVSDSFHPVDRGELDRPGSYLLFVGDRGGYKHFDVMPDLIRRSGLELVFTGNPLSATEETMIAGIEHKCHYAGRVDTDELNRLYAGAFALVYPSAYEGFGLPVLEAQKAGCPVIACKASSIPEIIGETPLLIDRPSAEAIIPKLRLLEDDSVRARVTRDGERNAARFSWDKMYQEVVSLYREAIVSGKRRKARGCPEGGSDGPDGSRQEPTD